MQAPTDLPPVAIDTDAPRRRWLPQARGMAVRLGCTLCFRALGFLWSSPRLRARRLHHAERCGICARNLRLRKLLLTMIVVLLVTGAAARAYVAAAPSIVCHSHITADGQVQPEPLLHVSPQQPWQAIRTGLVAPISGVGALAGGLMDMRVCSGPPLQVMFWLPPRTSRGGTTIGDVFVAWMPQDNSASGALSTRGGYGLTNEGEPYLRYGPNTSQSRGSEEELGRHESRHVDQWALGSIAGGPLAFPVAYALDGAFFPGSRNHFERAADLSGGGYDPAPDNLPAPRWLDSGIAGAVVWLALRHRLRWISRAVLGSGHGAVATGRCGLHTPGRLHTQAPVRRRRPVGPAPTQLVIPATAMPAGPHPSRAAHPVPAWSRGPAAVPM
jgi:hypothetical protein